MSVEIIRVEPAPERRQCFARWAVAQTPKVRTADFDAFAVPSHLFTEAPEGILIGALVDGRLYVPVEDDQEDADGGEDGLRWAEPGQPLPPVPESAYGPDAVPLEYAPLDEAPTGDEGAEWPEGITPPSPAFIEAAMDAVLIAHEVRADSDSSDSGDEDEAPADGYLCDLCERSFTTAHGRRTHRRQTHSNRRS